MLKDVLMPTVSHQLTLTTLDTTVHTPGDGLGVVYHASFTCPVCGEGQVSFDQQPAAKCTNCPTLFMLAINVVQIQWGGLVGRADE